MAASNVPRNGSGARLAPRMVNFAQLARTCGKFTPNRTASRPSNQAA
jgi:hypothetical protein